MHLTAFVERGYASSVRTGPDAATRTELSPGGPRPDYAARFCPGQVIAGRFTVIRSIARGGMGDVYEVEDRLLQGVSLFFEASYSSSNASYS